MQALWKSPFGRWHGEQRTDLGAAADSPNIVTLPGSPPKRAMLSRTHSSAAIKSSCPTLPVAYPESMPPSTHSQKRSAGD